MGYFSEIDIDNQNKARERYKNITSKPLPLVKSMNEIPNGVITEDEAIQLLDMSVLTLKEDMSNLIINYDYDDISPSNLEDDVLDLINKHLALSSTKTKK